MDTLTLDVRGLPDERVRQLQQLVDIWKRKERPDPGPVGTAKRKVDPSEFRSFKTRLTGPLTRALAYE